jgi:hypothetical protein
MLALTGTKDAIETVKTDADKVSKGPWVNEYRDKVR